MNLPREMRLNSLGEEVVILSILRNDGEFITSIERPGLEISEVTSNHKPESRNGSALKVPRMDELSGSRRNHSQTKRRIQHIQQCSSR